MLGKDASDFLIPAQQYLDIKFNEKAIMKGVKEENPYALRLFQDVFESKIEQKKTRSKKLIKMKMKMMKMSHSHEKQSFP